MAPIGLYGPIVTHAFYRQGLGGVRLLFRNNLEYTSNLSTAGIVTLAIGRTLFLFHQVTLLRSMKYDDRNIGLTKYIYGIAESTLVFVISY